MAFTILDFGETRLVEHALGADDVPQEFYDTAASLYSEMVDQIGGVLPTIEIGPYEFELKDLFPDVDSNDIKRAVGAISPGLDAWYRVSPGSCDDLAPVTITLVDDMPTGLMTGGASVWDIEISVSADYKIIAHDPELRDVGCPTEEYQAWLAENQAYMEAFGAYIEVLAEQGVKPPEPLPERPEPFDGEEFEAGEHKFAKFEINWYLTVTILRFQYRARVATQEQYISTKCCAK